MVQYYGNASPFQYRLSAHDTGLLKRQEEATEEPSITTYYTMQSLKSAELGGAVGSHLAKTFLFFVAQSTASKNGAEHVATSLPSHLAPFGVGASGTPQQNSWLPALPSVLQQHCASSSPAASSQLHKRRVYNAQASGARSVSWPFFEPHRATVKVQPQTPIYPQLTLGRPGG